MGMLPGTCRLACPAPPQAASPVLLALLVLLVLLALLSHHPSTRSNRLPIVCQLRAQNGMEKRSPQQIAKDRASYVLDLCVAAPEEYSWEGTRAQLADLYEQADMKSIAAFMSA